MIKKLSLTLTCFCLLLVLSACSNQQLYKDYITARELLFQESSFKVTSNIVLNQFSLGEDRITATTDTVCSYVQGQSSKTFAMNIIFNDPQSESATLNSYYLDNLMYVMYPDQPELDYCQPCDDEKAMKWVMSGIINFPQSVILEQSSEATSDGQLITFVLDSKKYYEYSFPKSSVAEEYRRYYYKDNPVYQVWLDENKRIKKIFSDITSETSSITDNGSSKVLLSSQQITTIWLSEFGKVELKLPTLNPKDFRLLEKP